MYDKKSVSLLIGFVLVHVVAVVVGHSTCFIWNQQLLVDVEMDLEKKDLVWFNSRGRSL